jgi:hypothetical protein
VLDREVARFTAEPGGVGFEVPPWIDALEEEVERARQGETDDVPVLDAAPQIEQVLLSLDEIMIQLDVWQQLLD